MQVVRIGTLKRLENEAGKIVSLKFVDDAGKRHEAMIILADEVTKGVLVRNLDENTKHLIKLEDFVRQYREVMGVYNEEPTDEWKLLEHQDLLLRIKLGRFDGVGEGQIAKEVKTYEITKPLRKALSGEVPADKLITKLIAQGNVGRIKVKFYGLVSPTQQDMMREFFEDFQSGKVARIVTLDILAFEKEEHVDISVKGEILISEKFARNWEKAFIRAFAEGVEDIFGLPLKVDKLDLKHSVVRKLPKADIDLDLDIVKKAVNEVLVSKIKKREALLLQQVEQLLAEGGLVEAAQILGKTDEAEIQNELARVLNGIGTIEEVKLELTGEGLKATVRISGVSVSHNNVLTIIERALVRINQRRVEEDKKPIVHAVIEISE